MKQLEKNFTKYGYEFNQVARTANAAIYSQSDNGKIIAYETIEILHKSEAVVFGNTLPDREAYPSSEAWGSKGWTMPNLESAYRRINEIQATLDTRIK